MPRRCIRGVVLGVEINNQREAFEIIASDSLAVGIGAEYFRYFISDIHNIVDGCEVNIQL